MLFGNMLFLVIDSSFIQRVAYAVSLNPALYRFVIMAQHKLGILQNHMALCPRLHCQLLAIKIAHILKKYFSKPASVVLLLKALFNIS